VTTGFHFCFSQQQRPRTILAARALNWVKAREYLAAKYCGAKVSINRVHEAGRFDCWATRR
jgi:hypothetical protein